MTETWEDAIPVKNREAGKEVPKLFEIERKMDECDDQIEDVLSQYRDAARNLAKWESAWKIHRGHVIYRLVFGTPPTKTAEDGREAAALEKENQDGVKGRTLYQNYKLAEAEEKQLDKTLRGLQTRLSSLQSRYRGLRQATGLD